MLGLVFSGPGSPEPDFYYHVRFADLLARHAIPESTFPWASASTWATAFSDKDWLFHVALVPFVRATDDLVLGGKVATAVFATLLLLGLAFVLARRGAPRPGALAGATVLLSLTFLQRAMVLRTLTLAVLLALLLAWALMERRAAVALVVATVYPLTYAAIHFPILVALGAWAVLRLKREPLGVKPLAAVLAGTGLGLFLHPGFPRNLTVAWDQNARVLANAWTSSRLGLEQAVEFRALPVLDAARGSGPLACALVLLIALLLLADPRVPLARVKQVCPSLLLAAVLAGLLGTLDTRRLLLYASPAWLALSLVVARSVLRTDALRSDTAFAVALAGAAALGAALSARFFEYLTPLTLLALGLALRDVRASDSARARWQQLRASVDPARARILTLASVAYCLVLVANTLFQAHRTAHDSPRARLGPAARYLAAHAAPGEVVYHAAWDDFPELFCFAPGQRYLVAMDPAFLYYADPDHRRYDLWDSIRRGDVRPDAARAFGSRFLVFDASDGRFQGLAVRLDAAAKSGRAVLRDESAGVVVWELLGS